MTNYLKNSDILNETNREFDFFNFNDYAKNLYKSLRSSTGPIVTTLVGGYGTGKSVLLNEVKKLSDQSQAQNRPKWVFFECWQYPDKRDLWEGLILETVESIEGKPRRDKMEASYSDIPSWRVGIANFLKDTKAAIATVAVISVLSFSVFSFANNLIVNILISLLTAMAVVLLAAIEFTMRPDSKSSISRLSDYKSELESILKKHQGSLYIVLEDVDRAGDLGTRFFETVAHFIKSTALKQKSIKIIVPISDDTANKELSDSMDKVSDNILHFKPSYKSEGFLKELFTEEFLDDPTKDMLTSIIDPLVGRQISIRKMKHTLRNAIVKYKRLNTNSFNADLAICIAVEFSKYMKEGYGSSTLYSQASNHYKHTPLLTWATQKGKLDTSSDDPEKEIDPQDYFKRSPDVFDSIRYADQNTNTRRSKPIYRREYLISRAYFDDL